jgi:competence protein ComEA
MRPPTLPTLRKATMINPITARIAFALAIIVPALSFAATPVNVNQASAATIAKSLDGIGASRAQAIE